MKVGVIKPPKLVKRLFLLLAVLSLSVPVLAQLDTRHYIPPVYGRENLADEGSEDIFLLLSTPSATNISIRETDGAGNELSFSPVTISRSSPANIALSTDTGSSKGTGTKFLIPEDSLSTVIRQEGLILTANKAFFASIRGQKRLC